MSNYELRIIVAIWNQVGRIIFYGKRCSSFERSSPVSRGSDGLWIFFPDPLPLPVRQPINNRICITGDYHSGDEHIFPIQI